MSDPSFAVGVEVAVDEQLVGVHLLVTRLTTPSVQCWVLSDPRLRTSLSVWAQCSGRGVVGFRKIAVLDARKTHLGGGCWLLHASWRAAGRGRDGRVAGIGNVSVRSGPV